MVFQGYCSIDYPGGVCEFDCITGPDIRSFCTPDGTWDPYPTCDGDIRFRPLSASYGRR